MTAPKSGKEADHPRWVVSLLALACGLVVANLYYSQPLAGVISQALHMPKGAAGLVVTMTQAGYGLGLLLVVPLGDLLDPRAVVRASLVLLSLALLAAGLAPIAPLFLAAAAAIGLCASAVQVMVPFASHLAAPEERGKVVGQVVGGLMIGIMLARPVASLVAQVSSWRAPLLASALLMAPLGLMLGVLLPPHKPDHRESWSALMASMGKLLVHTPVLRRRALYQACMFGAFSVFWTASPLLLTGPDYGLNQAQVAIFALVGAAGAVSAPLTGRWADKGWTRIGSQIAMAVAALSFILSRFAAPHSAAGVVLLAVSGVMLDFSVTCTLVFGQRLIYSLSDTARSRMNGLFLAAFFVGGAISSALAGWTYAQGGWGLTSWLGAALPAVAFLYALSERRQA